MDALLITLGAAAVGLLFVVVAAGHVLEVYRSVKLLASPLDEQSWQQVADELGLEWQASIGDSRTLIGLVDGIAVTATAHAPNDVPETVISATIATDTLDGVFLLLRPRLKGIRGLLSLQRGDAPIPGLDEHFDVVKRGDGPAEALAAPEAQQALIAASTVAESLVVANNEVVITQKGHISDPTVLRLQIEHAVRAAAAIDAAT